MEAVSSVVVLAIVAEITGLKSAAPTARYKNMANTPQKESNIGNAIKAVV